MWLATKYGFYSIVQIREKENEFMVQARAEKDLKNLVKNVKSLEDRQIIVTKDADYHFRIIILQSELNNLMTYFSKTIDYPNFKNKINSIPDQREKLSYYHEIWETMYRYQKYSE